jgi:transcriptional regulator with XRE-family HTH domain
MAKYKTTPHQIARFGHIAVFLRQELARREMTPTKLTRALGMSAGNTAVYPWLRGSGAPGPIMRQKLARVFGVAPETFLARELDGSGPPTMVATGGALVPVATSQPVMSATPVMPAPARHDVLSFLVGSDGQARLRVDATLPLAVAAPLFRMLLDAGLVLNREEAGDRPA